jgi:ribosomal protein L20
MRMLGATEESLRASKQVENDCEIWAENMDTVKFFIGLHSQWNIVMGMSASRYIGLNYSGVESAMKMLKIKSTKEMFSDIQIMEREALEVLNKDKD